MFFFSVYGLTTFTLLRFRFNSEFDKANVRVPWSVDGRTVVSGPRNNYIAQKRSETELANKSN